MRATVRGTRTYAVRIEILRELRRWRLQADCTCPRFCDSFHL